MKFAVENFKIFKERTEFDIKPITILVGPNGSGKSSLIQAMQILSSFGEKDIVEGHDDDMKILTRKEKKESLSITLPERTLINIWNKKIDTFGAKEFKIELFPREDFLLPYNIDSSSKLVFKNGRLEFVEYLKKEGHVFLGSEYESFLLLNFAKLISIFLEIRQRVRQQERNYADELSLGNDFEKYILPNLNFEDNFIRIVHFKNELLLPKEKKEEIVETFFNALRDKGEVIALHKEEIFQYEINGKVYLFNIDTAKPGGTEFKRFLDGFVLENFKSCLQSSISYFQPFNFISVIRNFGQQKGLLNNQNGNELEKIVYKINSEVISNNERDELIDVIQNHLKTVFGKEVAIEYVIYPDGEGGAFFLTKNGEKINLCKEGFGVINLFTVLFNIALAKHNLNSGLKKILMQGRKGLGEFNYWYEIAGTDREIPFETYRTIFAIEEPEMNLHPNAQSKLADVFANSVNENATTFILETHSEYLIRRFQYLVAKGELKKEDIQIYYFNDPGKVQEGDEVVYPININADGSLSRPFGPGFFDEADKLSLELLLFQENQKN